MRKFTASLFTVLSLTSFAQSQKSIVINPAGIPNRGCGTMEALERESLADPRSVEIRKQIEIQTADYIANQASNKNQQAVINIPVVFHVVHNPNTPAENVPDAVIMDQLRVLNEDLRKLNADASKVPAAFAGIAADCEINLCLAQRDPAGNPTTGITRTATTDASFGQDNQIKYTAQGGKDVWDRNKYLNIWVGDLTSPLLGRGQFPGGAAATDGVVIHYKYTGSGGATYPYDKGRTLTHELGHWLNLRHIWGDDTNCTGSDQVNDTPNQGSENYTCHAPGTVVTSTCGAGADGSPASNAAPGIMWQNFMDYTDDACMYMFTTGQKNRMKALLTGAGARASLATSLGCTPIASLDASITAILNPSGGNCNTSYLPVVTLKNKGTATLIAVTINYNVDGGTNATYNWAGSLANGASVDVTLPSVTTAAGVHTFNAFTSAPNGGADQLVANDSWSQTFTIIASNTPMILPFTEGFQAATFPPANWALINGGATNTWTRVTGRGGFSTAGTAASARMDNFTGSINLSGQTDDLITPAITLASANSSLKLKFNRGYARYNDAYYDTLLIQVSSNCGNSWTTVYSKGGTALETKTPQTTAFAPTATQWAADSVSLSSLAGLSDVRFRFRNLSGSGNNLFIDDINLAYTTAPAPVANFTAASTTVCAGSSIVFTDASTNSPTSWSWSFPGGTPASSPAQNPTVVYNTAGVYNVTLTSNNGTSSAPVTKTGYITVNAAAPVSASNTASSTTICEGTNVTFTAAPTNGGTTPAYQWKLNGANVGSNSTTYSNAALVNGDIVTVELTSDETCATGNPATSNAVTMTVNPNLAVSANNTASSTTICEGTNVTFTAAPTNGGTTPAYQWKLNGANVGTNSTTYSNAALANGDIITVELTSDETCAIGNPATSNAITMTVDLVPTAGFNFTTTGADGTFTNTSTGVSPTYTWDFGDSQSSTATSPVHTYAAAGTYTVTLTVTDGACSNTSTQIVTIVITGIKEVSNNDAINVYPNPSDGILNIQYASSIMGLTVNVYNSIGKIVKTVSSNNKSKMIIDLSGNANGVYYIVGKYDGGVITKKISILR